MSDNKMMGRAKKYDGTAIDYVSIFNWVDGKCIAQVKPDALGAWLYRFNASAKVGITYVADGCEPITHGAYDIEFVGYRWWRIKNITVPLNPQTAGSRAVAELRFNTRSGVISNNPSKAISLSEISETYNAAKAFDGNNATLSHSLITSESVGSQNNSFDGYAWYIGYEFDDPQVVDSVTIQMRQDMQPIWKQEWQTADIEVSNDGLTWIKFGTIEPKIASMDLSLITKPIILD